MGMTPPLRGTRLLKIIFDKDRWGLYRDGSVIDNRLQ
jgi:hypothetical protein